MSVLVKLIAVAIFAAGLGIASVASADVMLITNTRHAHMTQADVRSMFAMRLRQWPDDGAAVIVFVLGPSDPTHAAFCKRILDVFPYQLQRAWDRLVYSGTGQAPFELNSMEEMKWRVATTPGAIGYITTDRMDERVNPLRLQ